MNNIHEILKTYWGYESFRSLQEDIINSVLKGNDTLALLPTGGGKSVCFQIPALVMGGVCIVVTPLIALMKDQVHQLKRRNISAASIYSGMSNREIDITLDNCIYGQVKFLYVSPERLKTEIFIERAQRMKVSLLAIDEAHCISQWGYNFRPPYLEIAKFRSYIPQAKIIALTASATAEVEQDIIEKLEFKRTSVFRKSFSRTNLSYSCIYEENKLRKLLQILKKVPGASIVYVRSRKRTKDIANELKRSGIKADYYHAGISTELRSEKQEAWINNRTRVIVATNAFGMGIDKPDVRTVVHMDLPDNLESYYQEAGRAGRDEKKAFAVVLFDHADLENLRKRIELEFPPVELMRKVYQCLSNYLKVAVGSSSMASFDFDLEDFQTTFKLEPMATYYCIKKLEEEGFIQLNESFYNPSKLNIPVSNTGLYEFLIAHGSYDHIIKTILRMYGGEIFNHYINISEKEIARNAKLSPSEVNTLLTQLNQRGIFTYEPKKEKPQLTFIAARYDAASLQINIKALEQRKKKAQNKVEAVIHYTEHLFRCRTNLILQYFNEEPKEECGVCDNCLSKRKLRNEQPNLDRFRIELTAALKERDLSINELIESLKPAHEKELISCIRTLVSTSEIKYQENGKLSLFSKP